MSDQVFAPGEIQSRQVIEPGPRDIFFIPFNFLALAAAGVATQTYTFGTDANFYLTALSYQADLNGAALTEDTNVIPLVTALINDTGSDRNLMGGPIPIPAFFGDGKRPYRLIHPRLFKRTATISIAVQNYSAATTYNLRAVLHGFKVYGNNR